MKKLLLVAFLFTTLCAIAQPYGNEWINYSSDKRYFKLKVHVDGMYRVDYSTINFAMQSIGQDISTIDPQSLQLFARGEEQHIYVSGENDGSFDTGDYLEFYGEKNLGELDEGMYPSPEEHTNPYFSLYNDTLSYFLTWDPAGTLIGLRMQEVSYGTPVSTTVNYIIAEERVVHDDVYQQGEELGAGKPYVQYNGGKGWMSRNIGYNSNSTRPELLLDKAFPQVYTQGGAPNASFELALAGVNQGANDNDGPDHHTQLILKPDGSTVQVLEELTYERYEYVRETVTFSPNQMTDPGFQCGIRIASSVSPLSTAADYSAASYFTLQYPHTLNLENLLAFKFKVPASNITAHFSSTDFGASSVGFMLDLESHKRYEVEYNSLSGSIKTNIESGAERWFFVCANAQITTISSSAIEAVNGDGRFTDPSDWYRDSAYLMITHPSLMAQAQAYQVHREQTQNPVLIDIQELRDQFGFGIRFHPAAIRNFCDYALNEWATEPQYLFLIGKSIGEEELRFSTTGMEQSLVPTIGYPPTDNLLTAGLNGNPSQPAIATGRIAVANGTELTAYLNKVKELEQEQASETFTYTLSRKGWQKRILHFAGGDNTFENETFKNYLGRYETQVNDPNFGAEVFEFSKTSSQVIQQLNTDSVRFLISDGAAVMTFFGHASNNGFDISVDDPSQWDNQGRYPFVIANSCYSGNIHKIIASEGSVSENYVLTPNQGAIAFIATPDLSFENSLDRYTRELYFQFSEGLYGKSISKQMQQTALNVFSLGNKTYESVALEMTLHGDPVLKIYPHQKTELVVNDYEDGPQIDLVPEVLTTEIDSFDLIVNLTNIGRATADSFSVTVERRLTDGTTETQAKLVRGISFKEPLAFRFGINSENGTGLNDFRVEVDFPNGVIDEFDNTGNNIIESFQTQILSSEVFPIYPYNFAVVPDLALSLKANTGSPFLPAYDYTLQLDTTDTYSSPFLKQQMINQEGAVLSWDPQLELENFADSTVFFWRVSRTDSNEWREFSFQYIPTQEGWGQEHFFQFKNNDFDFLEDNRDQRLLELGEGERELTVKVIGNSSVSNTLERDANEYRLDGKRAPFGEYGIASLGAGLAVVVIDSSDLMPWGCFGYNPATGLLENENRNYGNNNHGTSAHRSRVEYFFTFSTNDSAQMSGMVDMITNQVEDGHYILIYTQINGAFKSSAQWTPERFAALEALGADSVSFVEDTHPYIFLVKKGQPNTAKEWIGRSPNEVLQVRETLTTTINTGDMTTSLIGPSQRWNELHWTTRSLDTPSVDENTVTIIGVREDGTRTGLLEVDATGVTDLSTIDASTYPFLALEFATEDPIKKTAGQLRNWHILYDPVPEVALNPANGYVTPPEKVQAGNTLNFGISLDNISAYGYDSLAVDYWVQDANGIISSLKETTVSGPQALTSRLDTVSFSSRGLSGNYTIWMRANPKGDRWQLEQFDFNNTAFRSFSVTPDNTNPLLDVTFDGIHILDGDIVAPQPEITIQLNDENQFLLLNDTALVDIFLTYPTGNEERISYMADGQEIMFFQPAVDVKNKAKIVYTPQETLPDGDYILRVAAQDASGNIAGKTDYAIGFEVINRSTITNVMNYPNPFSTSTRFVFTLTGSQVPDVFTIQIMTVTGKVIREITKDELGSIRMGRNITEYAWDGRDEFGDKLGNGVYLYRVITKISGKSVESRETEADGFFKEGFGKMYLMR